MALSCANCHQAERVADLLCLACRSVADRLIAETAAGTVLVSGAGPWDLDPMRRPPRRFPGLAIGHES